MAHCCTALLRSVSVDCGREIRKNERRERGENRRERAREEEEGEKCKTCKCCGKHLHKQEVGTKGCVMFGSCFAHAKEVLVRKVSAPVGGFLQTVSCLLHTTLGQCERGYLREYFHWGKTNRRAHILEGNQQERLQWNI